MSTATTPFTEAASTPAPDHPLSPLTADEITAVKETVSAAGLVTEHVRFVYVGLEEPPKSTVLAFRPGEHVERRARVLLLDRATGAGSDHVVSVTERRILGTVAVDAATDGHVPILDEEFEDIESFLLSSFDWIAAMAARGIDPQKVRAVPLSAGVFGHEDEVGHRIVRVLAFHQEDEADLPWAHPIDGVVAYVDLTEQRVVKVVDEITLPVPAERGEWDAAPHATPVRTDLKPIEITQPEGPSFSVDGNRITWADWTFRFGFDVREGLTLHQLSFSDDGVERPVIYRASIAEMVVPYADPSPVRYWQNYFDQGEYLFGRYTNSLELGCDCLGEIQYFDVTIADEKGDPRVMKNAICLHEEDYGVLWKHTDMFNGMTETRRSRRLVISFFLTIGNYDYGFYWYLYLDGTIELEAKATGIVFTSAYRGEDGFATEMAPGLGAPFHQHLFSARLDMAVDGNVNTVEEVDAVPEPMGPDNPWGNAFRCRKTTLTTEAEGQRLADNTKARVWHITNPTKQNRLGRNVGYALHPEGQPVLLADPSSSIAARAAFATRHLWVTQYDPAQRYPAGDFVNQHPGQGGLPTFVAGNRNIEGEDLVLWHTFGLTHFPRPEDWPVMPVDYAGFTLKPVGFFDRNPALDVPAGPSKHCCTD
ncbi:primary-amine oxidase [Rhodococcus ruber]|uniref:Amine oxidase n=1 Tax=Rhodococcus ruber TaxID=1830 RepID=A0A098BNS3_9NOCA|nr:MULTISPECIES: primary-amine oxidase [Rhodococcus]MCD2127909.1 primary-amine oxidase [Rhodococcus ruber]MCZ1075003.1 primary-amine oxidase [Rhodococcus sp. A5(2022)]MCZ4504568.1 primary-amine oxidase [Rhodococcus ruber]MCZ4531435.1 primary-amine oxidase [Rhodococcus ruber]MCZ4622148.1 primary-amine oxidase [Rhodococcus ruber]